MQDHHIHRILSLLGDWESRRITVDKKHSGLLQPYWNHYTQWKWFFRDIGKRDCVLGLLPFAEMALHTSQTPLPEKFKHPMESREALRRKIDLVVAWVEEPTKAKRHELTGMLPPEGKALADYSGFGLLPKAAESFINNLPTIIVAERKFQSRVHGSFYLLKRMGYHDIFIDSVFKANVLAVYRERLDQQCNIWNARLQ